MQTPLIWAIVPAAGRGKRLASEQPKQYLNFHGRALIEYTLSALLAYEPLQKCLVMLSKNDSHWSKLPVSSHAKVERVQGGAERMDSVYQGLLALKARAHPNDWVMVHDAARALIQTSELHRLFKAIERHSVGGLLGVPARDTLKVVGEDYAVARTLDRTQIWQALTPQAFRFGTLLSAFQEALKANQLVTDEAQAIERIGGEPLMVSCKTLNLKLTYHEDIQVFESLLNPNALSF